MRDTQFNARLSTATINKIKRKASEKGTIQAIIVTEAIERYDGCACNGSGIMFRHRGEWIYCACKAGLDAEMNHMAARLQAIAGTMQQLRIAGREDSQEYDDWAFLFERITAEHDDLERQWQEVLR